MGGAFGIVLVRKHKKHFCLVYQVYQVFMLISCMKCLGQASLNPECGVGVEEEGRR